MRLKIKLTANKEPIVINNQHLVNSYIHKCLGENNEYHDAKSDYCISNLRGGHMNNDKETLNFDGGAFIIVTSMDNDFIGKLMCGMSMNTDFGKGMTICGYEPMSDDLYGGFNIFRTLTPVLIKEYGTDKFKTIKDDDYADVLKKHIINKFTKINPKLDFRNFDVTFANKNHPSNKTKLIRIKGRANIASQFDVIINSNKEVAEYIYNYGLGQSTGSGFGTVYNPKNHFNYYAKL